MPLGTNAPLSWEDYNNDINAWARWYIDSLWVPAHQNDPDPGFQPGFFKQSDFLSAYPWNEGDSVDLMELQPAHTGESYVGFDTRTDDLTREGIQQQISNCALNSGNYSLELWWARTYDSPVNTKVTLSLARKRNRRHFKFDNFKINQFTFTPGEWNYFSTDFEVKLTNKHRDLNWLSVTGRKFWNSNPKDYMYFDDIRLYRECDLDSACFRPTGQICPTIATQAPPAAPFLIKNIGNANALKIRIFAGNSGNVLDTTYINPNGLPDFYMPADLLATQLASSTYQYEITLSNKCGAVEQSGSFTVLNGIYDTLGPWVDTTATWSETPVECCLHTLTLRDMEINGNVSYIVKDTIWITDGVTSADSSHILIQAGQVVEMNSVEFDGATTTVEILEAPCQGCRLAPPSPGGTPPSFAEIGKEAVISGSGPGRNVLAISEGSGKGGEMQSEGQTEVGEKVKNVFETGLSAFPNPFDKVVSLEFSLQKPEKVSLTVLDAEGRQVLKVLEGEWLWSGRHAYQAQLGNQNAGVYLVHLEVGESSFVERIVKQ